MSVPRANLSLIHPSLHHMALEALDKRDALGFLGRSDNQNSLTIVAQNRALLIFLGMFERALLEAFTAPRANTAHVSPRTIASLFAQADRRRLAAAGDPLPAGRNFRLYRGVAGEGVKRRERGLSWTSDKDQARFFAKRACGWGLERPAIMAGIFQRTSVLAFLGPSFRHEDEFVVRLSRSDKLETESL